MNGFAPTSSARAAQEIDLYMFAENQQCTGASLTMALKPEADRCGLLDSTLQEVRPAYGENYSFTWWDTTNFPDSVLDSSRPIRGEIVVGSIENAGAGQATLELRLSVLVERKWKEIGREDHTYEVMPGTLHQHPVKIRPELDGKVRITGVRLTTISRGIAVGHGFYELSDPASHLTIPIIQKPLKLTSASFKDGRAVSSRHHCHFSGGKGISPAFAWQGGPRVDTYALVLRLIRPKPEKERGVSWIVYDIPGRVRSMPEGRIPKGAKASRWAYGDVGMCPAAGGKYRFRFTLYALNGTASSDLANAASQSDVEKAVRCCASARASIDGTARMPTP